MTRPYREPVLRVVPGPTDINANGHIFGGWVLSQMDIAAGIVASRRAQGPVATIAIDRMEFIAPIHLRDLISRLCRGRARRPNVDGGANRGHRHPRPRRDRGQGHRRPVHLRRARRASTARGRSIRPSANERPPRRTSGRGGLASFRGVERKALEVDLEACLHRSRRHSCGRRRPGSELDGPRPRRPADRRRSNACE